MRGDLFAEQVAPLRRVGGGVVLVRRSLRAPPARPNAGAEERVGHRRVDAGAAHAVDLVVADGRADRRSTTATAAVAVVASVATGERAVSAKMTDAWIVSFVIVDRLPPPATWRVLPNRDDRSVPGEDRLVDRDDDREHVEVGEVVDGGTAARRRLQLRDQRRRGRRVDRRAAGGVERQAAGGAGDDPRRLAEAGEVEEEGIVAQPGEDAQPAVASW